MIYVFGTRTAEEQYGSIFFVDTNGTKIEESFFFLNSSTV